MASSPVRGEKASYPVRVGAPSDDPAAEYVTTGFVAGVKVNRTAWFAGDGVLKLVEDGLLIPIDQADDPREVLVARQQELAETDRLEQKRAEYRELTGEDADRRWKPETLDRKLEAARGEKDD